MRDLDELLKRISTAINKKTLAKEAVVNLIRTHAGVVLSPENIHIKDGVVEVSASPVAKNTIAMKSSVILRELKEVHGICVSRILYK